MAARDAKQELLDALKHPLRRNLLRRYLESKEKLSPRELAEIEKQSLSLVSYHVRRLVKLGALELVDSRQVRGSLQHFYRPTALVKSSPLIRVALGMRKG